MASSVAELTEFASRRGVDFERVRPLSRSERLTHLRAILSDEAVPYPIEPKRAEAYYREAEFGKLFGVGSLSSESVNLLQYADFQEYEKYSVEEEHLSWACLIAAQQQTKNTFACREYVQGEKQFAIRGEVLPDYYLLNARIYQQTQWQLATVSTIIPDELFFTCHSKRFFPVTTFMRPKDVDYLEKPDMGHDIAGHVATFTIPAVSEVMKQHGDARNMIYDERDRRIERAQDDNEVQAIKEWADELLAYAGRIYWFTVEFGLVMQGDEIKAFGAGILSSPSETEYSIVDQNPNRILIDPADDQDLLRLATTNYLIREFQKTYFVMKSFQLLEQLTADRIVRTTKLAMQLPHYTWNELAPGDDVLNVGTTYMSPNEKYYRLKNNDPIQLLSPGSSDYVVPVTAVRNLRMYLSGFDQRLLEQFKLPPPPVPSTLLNWFRQADTADQFPPDLTKYKRLMGAKDVGYGTELWPDPN